MTTYRVTFESMTAFYGPSFVEAENEYEARKKFAGTAFSTNEMSLIKVKPVSQKEVLNALRKKAE